MLNTLLLLRSHLPTSKAGYTRRTSLMVLSSSYHRLSLSTYIQPLICIHRHVHY